jgi:hypothetical protein
MLLVGTDFTYAQPPQGQEEKKTITAAELVKQMDADKDGKLSKIGLKVH